MRDAKAIVQKIRELTAPFNEQTDEETAKKILDDIRKLSKEWRPSTTPAERSAETRKFYDEVGGVISPRKK